MSNETQTDDYNSPDGVVLSNASLPSIGFLVGFAIYDGSHGYASFVESLRDNLQDDAEGINDSDFESAYRYMIPTPRHGGSAFSQAVRSLVTRAKMVVHDDPDSPTTNNKEGMRIKRNGDYGYTTQWTIVALRTNKEYALRRTRRGYIDGQPRQMIIEDTPYRIRKSFPNAGFCRVWNRALVDSVWNNEEKAPNVNELRRCVVLEPMKAQTIPEDGRFMRQAQERLRDAFVQASTSIDDDKMRKKVRNILKENYGGILPHASSGGTYFIYDPEKSRLKGLNILEQVTDWFASCANSRNRAAMWVEREQPWWGTVGSAEQSEIPIVAHYESGMRTLAYGSSAKQLDDIKKMYVSTMQTAQMKYYQLVQKMLKEGIIDEEALKLQKDKVKETLDRSKRELGADTVTLATARYTEVRSALSGRLANIWTPAERESAQEQARLNSRIHEIISFEEETTPEETQ
jgi:uncharacterized protein YutE (UPF0331/DUF86 family)